MIDDVEVAERCMSTMAHKQHSQYIHCRRTIAPHKGVDPRIMLVMSFGAIISISCDDKVLDIQSPPNEWFIKNNNNILALKKKREQGETLHSYIVAHQIDLECNMGRKRYLLFWR